MAAVAKLVISESRAFPEIGQFYLKEVIGRGLPLMEGLIRRGIDQGEFRKVDAFMTVRSMMGPMLLAMRLAHGVRADRRREARCAGAGAAPRRPDAARATARCRRRTMKRAPLIAIAAVAAAVLVSYVVWGDRLLALVGIGADDGRYLGYVEGETSLIAPPTRRPADRAPRRSRRPGEEGRPVVRHRSRRGEGRGCARRGDARGGQGTAREHADRQAAGGAGRDPCPAPRGRGGAGAGRGRAEAADRAGRAQHLDPPGLRAGRFAGAAAQVACGLAGGAGARRAISPRGRARSPPLPR